MTDCSLFSKERLAVFRKLPLPQIMQYHINTLEVSRLIKNFYHMLQYQRDTLNIIYSSNILLYMFRVSSTHLQEDTVVCEQDMAPSLSVES